MEKTYLSNVGSGKEYTIRKAPAGNWVVDVRPYGEPEATYVGFNSEDEAYSFVLEQEGGEIPYLCPEEEEED